MKRIHRMHRSLEWKEWNGNVQLKSKFVCDRNYLMSIHPPRVSIQIDLSLPTLAHTVHSTFYRWNAFEVIRWLKRNNRNWQPTHTYTLSPILTGYLNQSICQQCNSTRKLSSHRCDSSQFQNKVDVIYYFWSMLLPLSLLSIEFIVDIRYCSGVLHLILRVHFSLTQTDIIRSLKFKNRTTELTAAVFFRKRSYTMHVIMWMQQW